MRKIIFVTFVLNMTVRLPVEKKEAILKLYFKSIIKRSHINTIREFSRLIVKLVATEPGKEYTQLRYKTLERMNYR